MADTQKTLAKTHVQVSKIWTPSKTYLTCAIPGPDTNIKRAN